MNKFFLLTILIGAAAGAKSLRAFTCFDENGKPTSPDELFPSCAPDVGDTECSSAYDSNQLDDKTREYVNCVRVKSHSVKQLSCPALADKNDVCVPDVATANGKPTECARWREAGECFKEPDKNSAGYEFMIPHCMSTCCNACAYDKAGRCPLPGKETPERCRNRYSTNTEFKVDFRKEVACESWARAGECSKNPVWMHRNCAKHCCPGCNPKAPAPLPLATLAPAYTFPAVLSGASYSPVRSAAAPFYPATTAATTTAAPLYTRTATASSVLPQVPQQTMFGGYSFSNFRG